MNNTFSFTRHGRASQGIFMGMLDFPLSTEGVDEALSLRERLKDSEFDAAFSSPALRTYHTACISLGLAVPRVSGDSYRLEFLSPGKADRRIQIITDPRILERSYGDLQGERREGYENRFPKYEGRNVTKSFSDKADGGESFSDLRTRVVDFMEEVGRAYEGKRIFVSSHNGPLRIIRGYIGQLSEEEILKLSNPHAELQEFHI